MSNVFRRSLEEITDRRLGEDSKLLSEIWQLQLRLNGGHFSKEWLNALMQTYRGKYDIYDAFGFAVLWSGLLTGEIYYAVCDIGRECGSDQDISTNHGFLSSLTHLAGPRGSYLRCKADFFGGLSDSDGFFEWLDPLEFQYHADSGTHDNLSLCRYSTVSVDRGRLPLEVGYTEVGTSFGHIFAERGLVRWPYRSTRLYLFYAPYAYDKAHPRDKGDWR